MGKKIGEYQKQIASLETLWYDDVDNRINVTPILELVSRMQELKYIHLTCNTKDEFKYNLAILRRKLGCGVLYLAFHGQPGQILMTNRVAISLEELSQIMGQSFAGWVLHFGSCGILNTNNERIGTFIKTTKLSMVSGYTSYIDWLESAAMDILYFQQLQYHNNMQTMWNALREQYGELISRTGFHVVLP